MKTTWNVSYNKPGVGQIIFGSEHAHGGDYSFAVAKIHADKLVRERQVGVRLTKSGDGSQGFWWGAQGWTPLGQPF